ncbi:MAG: phospholipid carrier-dependent glycosyltransferase [Anaerolineales bacterium]|nr:phospholipid carrier-dependent glycosyltransferase [Anaerolineales bacterium]
MKKNISRANLNELWFAILLLVLIVPSWIINIVRVINVDEPRWVIRGANFYYAITHGDFENTLYEYHPGVTNTWIVATAMHFYFPEYRGMGQGYFDPLKPKFEEFMRQNGKESIDLVRDSRLIQAGVLAILAVTGFLLLRLLIDQKAAFLSIALATISPFFLGHSRLLNIEGMLSMFVLVSFLGMQVYLNRERKWGYLLLSGIAFGLAQLSKSSSIVVLGLVGLMLFVGLFKKNDRSPGVKIWDAIRIFMIWLVIAALVYFILWPGMWVAPGKMLADVYGNAFSYAFQGARLEVTQELQPSSFSLVTGFAGIAKFIGSWLSSSTPLTWLGLIFATFALFSKNKEQLPSPIKSTLVYLAILGGLFIAMFGVAKGRNSSHYILSSYVCFDVMAGIGWWYLWIWLQSQWSILNRAYATIAVFILLIAAQIGFGLPYAPYYFTYKSPLTSQPATFGYGEGYSEAADYLAQKPNAQELRAYVYSGMGTFSFFFPGETLVFKRVYLIEKDFSVITEEMQTSDYLVLYPIVSEQQPETQQVFDALQGVQPEKIIYINGLEYVTIYKVTDIPQNVYDILTK